MRAESSSLPPFWSPPQPGSCNKSVLFISSWVCVSGLAGPLHTRAEIGSLLRRKDQLLLALCVAGAWGILVPSLWCKTISKPPNSAGFSFLQGLFWTNRSILLLDDYLIEITLSHPTTFFSQE